MLSPLLVVLALSSPALSQEYTIGPHDVLTIRVWGQEDLSKDYPVDPDGFIPFPLLGRVQTSGLTTKAFAARLKELLEKDYLVDPQVGVSVKEYLSRKVYVLGEAEKRGVFYLKGPTSLMEVLSQGGFTDKAAASGVKVVRKNSDGTQETFALDLSGQAPKDRNFQLQDGDSIVVPKGNTFFVFGEVKKPGAYQLDKETTILEGITIAGGFTDKASPGRTRLIRTTPTGQQVINVDVNTMLKEGRRDKAMALQENDVVVVPESFF